MFNYKNYFSEVVFDLITFLPENIVCSDLNKKKYYQFFIKNIDHSVHYELLFRNKLQLLFAIHSEKKEFYNYSISIFEKISNILNIKLQKNDYILKIEKEINFYYNRFEILSYMYNTNQLFNKMIYN